MSYSRAEPSQRFKDLIALYKKMHEEGAAAQNLAPEQTFNGKSLVHHVEPIRNLVGQYAAKSLLDYGAGKGQGYASVTASLPDGTKLTGLKTIWGLEQITLYDPGYAPISKLPSGRFDAVICTDVMEHCPEEDADWILEEIFKFADKFVYFGIACYPAIKSLPDGQNAHITVKSPGWWADKLLATSIKIKPPRYYAHFDISRERHVKIEG